MKKYKSKSIWSFIGLYLGWFIIIFIILVGILSDDDGNMPYWADIFVFVAPLLISLTTIFVSQFTRVLALKQRAFSLIDSTKSIQKKNTTLREAAEKLIDKYNQLDDIEETHQNETNNDFQQSTTISTIKNSDNLKDFIHSKRKYNPKMDQMMDDLLERLEENEQEIVVQSLKYNEIVEEYNLRIMVFPIIFFRDIMHLENLKFYNESFEKDNSDEDQLLKEIELLDF